MQRIEHLHVGEAIEEDDAVNQLVGVLHLFDGFLAPYLGQGLVAPVLQQAIVQPILVDGGELVTQRLVEIFDYGCISAHGDISLLPAVWQVGSEQASHDPGLYQIQSGAGRSTYPKPLEWFAADECADGSGA